MAFVLTINPQNALISLDRHVWGLPDTPSCRNFCLNYCSVGTLIFFHVTSPVAGIVGAGEIARSAFESTRPLYPIENTRNILYPHRFRFNIKSQLPIASWRLRAIRVPRLSYSQGPLSSVNQLNQNEIDYVLERMAAWAWRRIFVSYSHHDTDICLKLVRDLKAYGIRSWLDRARIRIGDDLPSRIRRGIIEASYFVPLLSQHSTISRWVLREISIARAQEQSRHITKILPVRIDSHPIPQLIRRRVYADLRNRQNYRRELKKLAARILNS